MSAQHRDARAAELARYLQVIALQARECAMAECTPRAMEAPFRAMADAATAIAHQTHAICCADAAGDLEALGDNISDICAALARAYQWPELSAHERERADADFRNKQMREAS